MSAEDQTNVHAAPATAATATATSAASRTTKRRRSATGDGMDGPDGAISDEPPAKRTAPTTILVQEHAPVDTNMSFGRLGEMAKDTLLRCGVLLAPVCLVSACPFCYHPCDGAQTTVDGFTLCGICATGRLTESVYSIPNFHMRDAVAAHRASSPGHIPDPRHPPGHKGPSLRADSLLAKHNYQPNVWRIWSAAEYEDLTYEFVCVAILAANKLQETRPAHTDSIESSANDVDPQLIAEIVAHVSLRARAELGNEQFANGKIWRFELVDARSRIPFVISSVLETDGLCKLIAECIGPSVMPHTLLTPYTDSMICLPDKTYDELHANTVARTARVKQGDDAMPKEWTCPICFYPMVDAKLALCGHSVCCVCATCLASCATCRAGDSYCIPNTIVAAAVQCYTNKAQRSRTHFQLATTIDPVAGELMDELNSQDAPWLLHCVEVDGQLSIPFDRIVRSVHAVVCAHCPIDLFQQPDKDIVDLIAQLVYRQLDRNMIVVIAPNDYNTAVHGRFLFVDLVFRSRSCDVTVQILGPRS